jgi:3D (Asp-Asp-Asp) domain-containing protein
MEGGFVDRKGVKLNTLQQFLDGKASYVSVAMDTKAFPYGQRLRINELNTKYKKEIIFRVVDTGGAFTGKGTSRIDICTANSKAAGDSTINGKLNIDVIDEKSGPPETTPDPVAKGPTAAPPSSNPPSTSTPTPTPRPSTAPPPPPAPTTVATPSDPPPSTGGGQACGSDGACNPGNDGSGLICVSSQCVPGCHSNAQCPGVTTCQSGQCR